MRVVFSIAGFDPSGGAGTLADIKTFAAFGCFGTGAITSLTSQNTVAVYNTFHQTPEVLRAQIEPVVADFKIAAVKIGMLPTRETVEVVAELIEQHKLPNIVLDPVISSASGYELVEDTTIDVLMARLLPLADLITPNLAEAERLTGLKVTDLDEMKEAGERLCELGARAALVKGGHLKDTATDVLIDSAGVKHFYAPRIITRNTHGTGCTLSSAIAALLARGEDLYTAINQAKEYLLAALRTAPEIGHGVGPLNHLRSAE